MLAVATWALGQYRAERRTKPMFWSVVELSACGTLGLALPDIIVLFRGIAW